MKKRIVFFTYLPLEYGGGVAKYFLEISQGLSERDSSIVPVIVTLDASLARHILSIYSLYFLGKQDNTIGNKEGAAGIRKKLTGGRYIQAHSLSQLKKELKRADAVYINNNILELFLLDVLIGIRTLPPLIVGFHTPTMYPVRRSLQSKLHNKLYQSSLYLSLLTKARRLHVVNRFDEKWYKKRLPGSDVRRIYYPFDMNGVRKAALRDTYPLPERGTLKRILWAGRLTEQKGVADLCELIAATHSTPDSPPFELFIAGEGELKKDVVKLAEQYNHVSYLGYVQNTKIPSVMSQCDIYLSTSGWESFPYTVLEAQSMGIPVIAYDINGVNDIIVHRKTGYLFQDKLSMQTTFVKTVRSAQYDRKFIKNHMRALLRNDLIFSQLESLFYDKT